MNDNQSPGSPTPDDGLPPAPSAPEAAKASTAPAEAVGWERSALERLAFAALQEQRAARRWRSFVRLAWLAFFVALIWMLMFRGGPSTDKSLPHTAVVEIKGEIAAWLKSK